MAEPPIFRSGKRRKSPNELSDVAARKIWLLLELIRRGRVTYTEYRARHGRDFRSFQRDLQQLRAIGKKSGFSVSRIKGGNGVELERFER